MTGLFDALQAAWNSNPLRGAMFGRDYDSPQADMLGRALPRAAQDIGTGLLTLPQRAFQSSANYAETGKYDPAPIVEAAMLPMGVGTRIPFARGSLAPTAVTPAEMATARAIPEAAMPADTIRAFHGSRSLEGPFDPYHRDELGPHFGSVAQAEERLGAQQSFMDYAHGDPRMVPVDMSIKNPLHMPDLSEWTPHNVTRELSRPKYGMDQTALDATYWLPKDAALDSLRKMLTQKGYDAIRYLNRYEGHVGDPSNLSYIPLKQGSVSSAISGATLFGLPLFAGTQQQSQQ